MKKNAFTLTELLGVITLMALLTLIVIPNVGKILKDSKKDLYTKQLESIKIAARSWGDDHLDMLPLENETKIIKLSELQNNGYLAPDLKNPITGENFEKELEIKITNNKNIYYYQILD